MKAYRLLTVAELREYLNKISPTVELQGEHPPFGQGVEAYLDGNILTLRAPKTSARRLSGEGE